MMRICIRTDVNRSRPKISSSPAIPNLPEICISHILSLTTPQDVCRSSSASSLFRSAANSDYVWEKMLPPDYPDILSTAIYPVEFASKKELYFRLCYSILIDSGRKSFCIEKSTARKRYLLSARELMIAWGDDSRYWSWISLQESRFSDVAWLKRVCWLDIKGKFNVRMLSPKTRYAAYLILRTINRTFGFNSQPVELSLSFEEQRTTCIAYLGPDSRGRHSNLSTPVWERLWSDIPIPQQGESYGWMEIKFGEFFTGEGGGGEVEVSLMETKSLLWKGGIAIEGIEIRPKKYCGLEEFDFS